MLSDTSRFNHHRIGSGSVSRLVPDSPCWVFSDKVSWNEKSFAIFQASLGAVKAWHENMFLLTSTPAQKQPLKSQAVLNCYLLLRPSTSQERPSQTQEPQPQPCAAALTSHAAQDGSPPQGWSGSGCACSTKAGFTEASRLAKEGSLTNQTSPGTTSPGPGTTRPGPGTTNPGRSTTSPGRGTTSPGRGTTSPGRCVGEKVGHSRRVVKAQGAGEKTTDGSVR